METSVSHPKPPTLVGRRIHFIPVGIALLALVSKFWVINQTSRNNSAGILLSSAAIALMVVSLVIVLYVFIGRNISHYRIEGHPSELAISKLRNEVGFRFIVSSGKDFSTLVFVRNSQNQKQLDEAIRRSPMQETSSSSTYSTKTDDNDRTNKSPNPK